MPFHDPRMNPAGGTAFIADANPGHHMNSPITGMLENGAPVGTDPALSVPKMNPFSDFDKKGQIYRVGAAYHALLDDAGMTAARIVASGDLEENQIAQLTAAGAPIDSFGVGTDLGTSRDSPVVNGIYKLVAHSVGGHLRDVRKRSPEKATVPGAKQVFRDYGDGEMRGDVIARVEETLPGRPLLVPFVRSGVLVREETIGQMSGRARAELRALAPALRELDGKGESYPVSYSEGCRAALVAVDARAA